MISTRGHGSIDYGGSLLFGGPAAVRLVLLAAGIAACAVIARSRSATQARHPAWRDACSALLQG